MNPSQKTPPNNDPKIEPKAPAPQGIRGKKRMTKEKKMRIALLTVLTVLVVLISLILAVLLPLFEAYRNSYVEVPLLTKDSTNNFQWDTLPPEESTDTAEPPVTEPNGTEPDDTETTPPDTEDTGEETTEPPETNPPGWNEDHQGVDENGIYQIAQKNPDVINILLIGTDSRDVHTTRGRSDSMIVCSYNKKTGKVTLLSLLRDTLVPIEGVGTFYQTNYGMDVTRPNQSQSVGGGAIAGYAQLSGGYGYAKLNFAYNFGGASACINTINEFYDLDIQKFVIINFAGASELVDVVGGVDIPLGNEEYARMTGPLKFELTQNEDGTYHLNGEQALAHMRNRYSKFGNTNIDDDFARTARQRQVIMAIYQQVVASRSVSEIYNLIRESFGIVRTNLNLSDLLDLAGSVLEYGSDLEIVSKQAPYNYFFVSYPAAGSSVAVRDVVAHRKWVNTLLFS